MIAIKKLSIQMFILCLPVILILILILVLILPGCSSRYQEPVTAADSTIVYQPKRTDNISAKITFCRKISKKTGKLIDTGTVFTIRNDEMVHAIVDLQNRYAYGERMLMFHVDWIDQDGSDLFMKRIDLAPGDSVTSLKSSVSVSPDKRQPGDYMFRVYLFRELIAEKKFKLVPERTDTLTTGSKPEKDASAVKTGKKQARKKKVEVN